MISIKFVWLKAVLETYMLYEQELTLRFGANLNKSQISHYVGMALVNPVRCKHCLS